MGYRDPRGVYFTPKLKTEGGMRRVASQELRLMDRYKESTFSAIYMCV